jgi:hypothetical protein
VIDSNLQNPSCGLSEIQIWEQATLEHLCILSILWFAFVTLGLYGPRWLGVAGEHPRACGVPQKVCTGLIPPSQWKESSSGRRKKSWKWLRLEWPSWSSRANLRRVAHSPPQRRVGLDKGWTSVKHIACLDLPLYIWYLWSCALLELVNKSSMSALSLARREKQKGTSSAIEGRTRVYRTCPVLIPDMLGICGLCCFYSILILTFVVQDFSS